MKRIIFLLIICIILTGCTKKSDSGIQNDIIITVLNADKTISTYISDRIYTTSSGLVYFTDEYGKEHKTPVQSTWVVER